MELTFINIFLGFVEGFALILSPCILPILPIFLATSLSGPRWRKVGMVVGFCLLFAIIIFFSRQLVSYLGINFDVVRRTGYFILFLLGILMMSDFLTEKFSLLTQKLNEFSNLFHANNQGGFIHGLFLGGLIALIWTPCAGPILAAVIVQTVVQQANIVSFFILLAFALGAIIPLFILSLYGKKIMTTFTFLKSKASLLRKLLGAILIASVIYLMYFATTIDSATPARSGIKATTSLIDGLWHPYPVPPIAGISAWINSESLNLNSLKGKVVLVDFWTYSCINCLRSLPYVKDWYQRYHDKGLVVIGVHTPEFDFEKDLANVRAAVQRYGILFPVALDNQFVTWNNFDNHYWPAHYLINKQGKVVYEHFGEGQYDVTENNIRFLLGINQLTTLDTAKTVSVTISQTPETYLGYERADSEQSPYLVRDQSYTYQYPSDLGKNAWALKGLWQVKADSIHAMAKDAAIKIHFQARKIFAVIGTSENKVITIKVRLNGGEEKTIIVDKYALYELWSAAQLMNANLELSTTEPGVKLYTFTFGN